MKGKLNNDKEKLCPFLPKSYFLFLLAVVASVSKNTCILIFFSINSQVILKNSRPLASNFSILLSNLLKKSQYKSFTTWKQQQLGENKKIRLWSTGNSYSLITNIYGDAGRDNPLPQNCFGLLCLERARRFSWRYAIFMTSRSMLIILTTSKYFLWSLFNWFVY